MRAKKHLGQHFLTSQSYLSAIGDAGEVKESDTVLEIGPGRGALTATLLARGAHVVAVEKDPELMPLLEEKFASEIAAGRLQLIEADALEFDQSIMKGRWKLVANIPYYITGALFEKFLSKEPRPETLVFLVQKEIAERIARDPKESLLSLSIKAYGSPRYVKTVPPGAFSPAPTVQSAILAVNGISHANFSNPAEEKAFFSLIHAGFAHKRKLLVRNLEDMLGKSAADLLSEAGIPGNARAEDISLPLWLALAKITAHSAQ